MLARDRPRRNSLPVQQSNDIRIDRELLTMPDSYSVTRTSVLKFLSYRNISAFYVLVAFIAIYSVWVPSYFLTWDTFRSVLSAQAITAMLAVFLSVSLSAGAFDLSVGSGLGVGSVLVAVLMTSAGLTWPLAIIVTLLIGCLIGLVNALLVVVAGVPSMVATLATSSILLGAGTAIGGNQIILGLPTAFNKIGQTQILGITSAVWILLGITAILWYVMEFTKTGRYLYATGGGPEAARLAGVRTQRIVVGALIFSAAGAVLVGMVASSTVGAGQSSVGPPYLLPAFAAAFLGATQFKKGQFNVWGTVLATYTIGFGVKGLLLGGAPIWLPDVFTGVALALAVALSLRRARSRVD